LNGRGRPAADLQRHRPQAGSSCAKRSARYRDRFSPAAAREFTALAGSLGLERRVASLHDRAALDAALTGIRVVLRGETVLRRRGR
jgi:hypothetical protein